MRLGLGEANQSFSGVIEAQLLGPRLLCAMDPDSN
jgi:hypothetical protein